jgi:type IV secretion system protein VirB4
MNQLMMGEHACAVTVFTDQRENLPQVVQLAWGDLSSGGIKIERESTALEGVLFSMVPGNFHLRGRQAAVSSRNFAAFASMHNFPAGERKGFWGDPTPSCGQVAARHTSTTFRPMASATP